MNVKPLADRVLIKPTPAEERTLSGIIIPDSAKEKPLRGTVIAAGNGTKDEEMVLKANDECFMASIPAQKSSLTVRNTSSCVRATCSL